MRLRTKSKSIPHKSDSVFIHKLFPLLTILLVLSDSSIFIWSVNASDLCYLSTGGSSETFTVNEAVPINTVIGTLQVIGNVSNTSLSSPSSSSSSSSSSSMQIPSSDEEVSSSKPDGTQFSDDNEGSIELSIEANSPHSRLDGQEVPITIEPGTKNLVLVRKLDKESPEGEQGIIVGIRCKKLSQKSEPSIIIPVRIIVTDANDHAPEFLGTPYVVNVSEVAVVGTPLMPAGRIRAVDNDQQGPFSTVEYYVEPGPFSHMAKFESQLGGSLILTAPLDYETLPKFWITIRTQDQGEPPNSATTSVTINVLDADDQNPRFLDDKYSAKLPESNREGESLIVSPRPIRAIDPDVDINADIEYSFNFPSDTREYSYFEIDPKYGDVSLKKSLASSVALPLTLVVRATQVDNKDRYALTTLTLFGRKQGLMPDIRFIKTNYTASLQENIPAGQVVLTVLTTRSESMTEQSEPVQYQILDDDEGYFGIRRNGEIILKKPLDYEQKPWYSFRVMASDGKQSDVARVNVSVLNVNDHDPQFSQNHYNFYVSEARIRTSAGIGEIKASDNDVGDRVNLSIKGPFAKMFYITESGLIKIKTLRSLNTTQCHLIVVATDSGSPPRSSSVPVTVQFDAGVFKAFSRNIDDIESYIEGNNGIESKGGTSGGGNGSGVDMNMIFNSSSSSAVVLVIVLGVLLATLFIIIITLTVHVLKQRKYPESSASSSTSDSSENPSSAHHHHHHYGYHGSTSRRGSSSLSSSLGKNNRVAPLPCDGRALFIPSTVVPGLGARGVENPIFNMPTTTTSNLSSRYYTTPPNSTSNKSDPDSAIVSDASTNSRVDHTDGGAHQEDRSSRSISPPPPPSITCTSTGTSGGGTASRISVVKWPQGSIPRRVKKLTWEDERFACGNGDGQVRTHHGFITEPVFHSNEDSNYNLSRSVYSTSSSSGGGGLVSNSSQRTTELDPDVSVAPLRRTFHHQHSAESGLPDLTVYF